MRKDIIGKLEAHLNAGIETEAQAVYLLAAVRKLLEQQNVATCYDLLKFHCDWALHTKLEGRAAQDILKLFDAANLKLRANVRLRDLPYELRKEINRISKMEGLQEELIKFLNANGLPGLNRTRSDGWTRFLHLYASVIEDCPLVMSAKKHTTASIEKVTVHLDVATAPLEGELIYKITWSVADKNGRTGDLCVLNSFSVVHEQPRSADALANPACR